MKEKESKYIKLLLEKCLNFEKSKSLFISYEKDLNEEFVKNLVSYAKEMGIEDIYLKDEQSYKKHEILKKISLEEIEKNPIFDNSIWDEYAKKNASFLMIETEIPGLMDDIDPEKISKVRYISRTTKPIYREKQKTDEIPWCICAYPNEYWAKDIFGEKNDAYELLFNAILDMCMCNENNPIEAWDKFLETTKERIEKLNNLKIKKMRYTNSLGTDLTVELLKEGIWSSAASTKNMIVNMPSYEVFTSPNTYKTEGIVYSSKPLIYNGTKIDEFYIEFKNGKVTNFDAKVGKEVLKGIIESDSLSNSLGECALVEYNSPISNTKLIFGTTLFDENASCHLALGAGFPECVKDYEKYKKEELKEMGLNDSSNHVDFMIGTEDLKIEAETESGNITIFENGNFVI